MRLEEEHHVGVCNRVAAVGGDHSMQDSAGNETEEESTGLLARTGDDGGAPGERGEICSSPISHTSQCLLVAGVELQRDG